MTPRVAFDDIMLSQSATERLTAEIARRDVDIEMTENRQRLVILSAERRALVLALDVIREDHEERMHEGTR